MGHASTPGWAACRWTAASAIPATAMTAMMARAIMPGRFLELAADVAAGVGAVAESHDVEGAERGHERDKGDHVFMIGLKRRRT